MGCRKGADPYPPMRTDEALTALPGEFLGEGLLPFPDVQFKIHIGASFSRAGQGIRDSIFRCLSESRSLPM